jgi:hypothetical protein
MKLAQGKHDAAEASAKGISSRTLIHLIRSSPQRTGWQRQRPEIVDRSSNETVGPGAESNHRHADCKLAALASPVPRHTKAQSRHTQSEFDTFPAHQWLPGSSRPPL